MPRADQMADGKLLSSTGSPALCSVPTETGGREAQGGGDTRILVADSWCTAETNTTLKAIILQLKVN